MHHKNRHENIFKNISRWCHAIILIKNLLIFLGYTLRHDKKRGNIHNIVKFDTSIQLILTFLYLTIYVKKIEQ